MKEEMKKYKVAYKWGPGIWRVINAIENDIINYGLCCAAVMRLKYPDIELIGWDYGDDPSVFFKSIEQGVVLFESPDLADYNIIMADVSMPFDAMLEIANRAEGFLWVDHHEKAIAELSQIFSGHSTAYMVGEPGRAACEWLWEELFPGKEMPLIVHALDEDQDFANMAAFYGRRMLDYERAQIRRAMLAGKISDEHFVWGTGSIWPGDFLRGVFPAGE